MVNIQLPELLDGDAASFIVSPYSDPNSVPNSLHINAAEVERVTTAGIQPLIALLRSAGGAAAAAVIMDASPAFRAAWVDFGLHQHFPLEQ